MSVEEQIAIIYAGTSGALDDVDTARVKEFEESYLRFMREKHGETLAKIREDKQWTDEVKATVDGAIEEFKKSF